MQLLFSDLVNRFLASTSKHLKPSTIAVYQHYFRRFLQFHGELPVVSIRPCHVQEFATSWHASQAIKRLFTWATLDAGLLDVNPLARVKHPPKGQRCRILGNAEMARLLRSTSADLRTLLIGYRETFARPDELRRACWDDLQPTTPGESINKALTSATACIVLREYKDRKRRPDPAAPRVLLLSPRVCRLLLRLWERSECKSGPIFLTSAGVSWTPNAVRCRFRRLRTRLKIQRDKRGETIVPYTFRHTGATRAAAAGIRDRVLADVLGHSQTSTTSRYQHLAVEHLRNALSAFWAKGSK